MRTQMMEKLILPSEMCVTHDRTAFRCRSNKEILPLHLHKLHPHILVCTSVHRPSSRLSCPSDLIGYYHQTIHHD